MGWQGAGRPPFGLQMEKLQNERHEVFFDHGLCEAVFAVDEPEMVFPVGFGELVAAVDDFVIFAKKSPDEGFFLRGNIFERERFLDFFEFCDHGLIDFKGCGTVLAFVFEGDVFAEVVEREKT